VLKLKQKEHKNGNTVLSEHYLLCLYCVTYRPCCTSQLKLTKHFLITNRRMNMFDNDDNVQ